MSPNCWGEYEPPVESGIIVRYRGGKMELYEPDSDEPFIEGKSLNLSQCR